MQTAARKLTGVSIISRRDPPEVLQATEHALDGVAITIEERREAVLPFAIGLGRDVWHRSAILDLPTDGGAIIALVAVQDFARWKPREKFRASRAISDVSAREHEGDGTATSIGQRVDFGRASAARAANGLIFLPPSPPLAERCALTAEESMRTSAGGPPACASAWNRSIQTPLAAQRT